MAGVAIILLALVLLAQRGLGSLSRLSVNATPEPSGRTIETGLHDASMTLTNPYSWWQLSVGVNGRYHYLVDGQEVSRTGVDVSEHQGDINWRAVREDGISFAIIRVGYRGSAKGNIALDAKFHKNLQAAKDAGLDTGVYFYSQALTTQEAEAEADFVLSQLNGTELNYPVAFDMEPTSKDAERIQSLSSDQINAIAEAFCARIEQGGYRTMIYGNKPDLSMLSLESFAHRGFWYACYDTKPVMDLAFGVWQYSSTGRVEGISTNVDLNIDLTDELAKHQG
ncbi:MAG: glycoside hydrolase family 25 protein [Atopobiaceae bacterium]